MTTTRKGVAYGIFAYAMWGLFPLYWRLLHHIPPIEILGHRIVWSFAVLVILVRWQNRWGELRTLLANWKHAAVLVVTSVLIALNWLIYIWGVNNGRVIECSLGYFILPLVNVAFGTVLFREQLRAPQWIAIGLATIGVSLRAWDAGGIPLVSAGLAITFAAYGILRKKIAVSPVSGLAVETGLIVVPAATFLLYREFYSGSYTLLTASAADWLLLVGAGIITSLPLLAFGAAARILPLTVLGVIQYLSPSLQFLTGVLLLGEHMPVEQWIAFAFIWCGLAIFTIDQYRRTHA